MDYDKHISDFTKTLKRFFKNSVIYKENNISYYIDNNELKTLIKLNYLGNNININIKKYSDDTLIIINNNIIIKMKYKQFYYNAIYDIAKLYNLSYYVAKIEAHYIIENTLQNIFGKDKNIIIE